MKFTALALCGLIGLTATAADPLRFEDRFADGDYTAGTAWKVKNGKEPWLVSAGTTAPSGNVIFDSISTTDFKPITGGAFSLSFKVIFTAAGHGVAWEIVQRLNSRISRLRALTLATTDRRISGPAHMARICAAICAGDAEAAAQAVREHLDDAAAIDRTLLETRK